MILTTPQQQSSSSSSSFGCTPATTPSLLVGGQGQGQGRVHQEAVAVGGHHGHGDGGIINATPIPTTMFTPMNSVGALTPGAGVIVPISNLMPPQMNSNINLVSSPSNSSFQTLNSQTHTPRHDNLSSSASPSFSPLHPHPHLHQSHTGTPGNSSLPPGPGPGDGVGLSFNVPGGGPLGGNGGGDGSKSKVSSVSIIPLTNGCFSVPPSNTIAPTPPIMMGPQMMNTGGGSHVPTPSPSPLSQQPSPPPPPQVLSMGSSPVPLSQQQVLQVHHANLSSQQQTHAETKGATTIINNEVTNALMRLRGDPTDSRVRARLHSLPRSVCIDVARHIISDEALLWQLLTEERGHVVAALMDRMQQQAPEEVRPIVDYLMQHLLDLVRLKGGSVAVPRVLHQLSTEDRWDAFNRLRADKKVFSHPFANFAVQHFIDATRLEHVSRVGVDGATSRPTHAEACHVLIQTELADRTLLLEWGQDRIASQVVDRVLQNATEEDARAVIENIFGDKELVKELGSNQFGHYNLKAAFEVLLRGQLKDAADREELLKKYHGVTAPLLKGSRFSRWVLRDVKLSLTTE